MSPMAGMTADGALPKAAIPAGRDKTPAPTIALTTVKAIHWRCNLCEMENFGRDTCDRLSSLSWYVRLNISWETVAVPPEEDAFSFSGSGTASALADEASGHDATLVDGIWMGRTNVAVRVDGTKASAVESAQANRAVETVILIFVNGRDIT